MEAAKTMTGKQQCIRGRNRVRSCISAFILDGKSGAPLTFADLALHELHEL
jgi:hypothetical protein